MNDTIVNTSLQGLMSSIKKSKYPLAPIYESITNSFEAILQKEYHGQEKPEIILTFEFTGLLEETKRLDLIKIYDNGLGFTNENYTRFKTVFDNSKGFHNRGSGRIQLLHRFSRIDVESFYEEDGYYKRSFQCNSSQFISSEKNEPDTEQNPSGSVVSLIPGEVLNKDQEYYDSLEILDLVRDLKRHFLLRFYLDTENHKIKVPNITIIFTKNNKEEESLVIKPDEMPKPTKEGSTTVPYFKLKDPKSNEIKWEKVSGRDEKISWGHFKLSKDDLNQNAIYLCSKGVSVEPLKFDSLKQKDHVEGSRYLTAFWGDLFDSNANISHSVDKFEFPEQNEIERLIKEGDLYLPNEEFLFFNIIKDEINKIIPGIYQEITDLKQDQKLIIEKIARENGISLEIAQKAKINISDNEEQITLKLYKAQSEYLSRNNQKIRKIFNQLNQLNPTFENYQEDLEAKSSELLSLIPLQNKEELGRYVIRREMVAEVLKKILAQELDYQIEKTTAKERQDKEGLIHDLIFKRRKNSSSAENNDLWILNEEFLHFEGSSELPIDKIEYAEGKKLLKNISQEQIKEYGLKPSRRPDIFLFVEEEKCILIEFKEPSRDMSDHLNQMTKYCTLIANYSIPRLQKFYCYLIGENINPSDLDGSYQRTFPGDWLNPYIRLVSYDEARTTVGTAQLEILKLSSLYDRAHRRNKSFADKLGLREMLDEHKAETDD